MKITMETDIRDYPFRLKIAIAVVLAAFSVTLYLAVKYEMSILLGVILFALVNAALYANARRNAREIAAIENSDQRRGR